MTPDHLLAVLGMLVLIVLAAVVWVFAAGKLTAKQEHIAKELEDERKELKELRELPGQLKEMKRRQDQLENQQSTMSQELHSFSNEVAVATHIADEAKRTISNNMPRVVAPRPAPRQLPAPGGYRKRFPSKPDSDDEE